MPTLKLDVDRLRVESFGSHDSPPGATGTVRAHAFALAHRQALLSMPGPPCDDYTGAAA
jgi:hypothetical protein